VLKVYQQLIEQIFSLNETLNHILTEPDASSIIEFISKRMSIALAIPEEIIIKEGETIQ